MTPALSRITSALDGLADHTPASLASALAHPIGLDDVASWIRFDPHNYVRSLVARTDRWELRLLCWRPGQSSSMHGHGPAACAFRVLRGSATESILGSRDRKWAPGDVVAEVGPNLVHQVSNRDGDALLTLHAYSPELPVDAPSPRDGHNVVILGGGFSGIAVAFHLLQQAKPDLRITIVERGPWLGRGIAYGVDSEVFRLNVPASRMSIDPERRDDFVRWAHAEETPHAFLPRTRYGAYVVERFADAIRHSAGKLRVVRGEAVRVDDMGVELADGTRIPASSVILATGLAPRLTPSSLPADPRIIDAWDECALAALPRNGRLLVLGSGLTALDVISFLNVHGFDGSVSVVSRRGLLPAPHAARSHPAFQLSEQVVADAPRELGALLRWGRGVVTEASDRGVPWQSAVDALRPHVYRIWRNLPAHDRARFVRFVRPYWEVLRHRAPDDLHELVSSWGRNGRLERVAGTVLACRPAEGHLDVTLRLAGGNTRTDRYDAIVRCIGPALSRPEADAPLIQNLFESGRATADPAGLGIVTDEQGRVVARDRSVSPQLYALGALRRASSWETTAVPEIVVHAAELARLLSSHR